MVEWKVKYFNELTINELYEVLRLRSEVFVIEQNCIYQDMDNLDQKAIHVIGYQNDDIVAYGRVLEKDDYISFGRIITNNKYRGKKYGIKLLKILLDICNTLKPNSKIIIEAQSYLLKFYENFGFKKVGNQFLLDGINHWKMEKN